MVLGSETVLALAPDASAATAGKKLAETRHWQGLGRNEQAVWGECQGSALYQVRADLATLGAKCSCPSRKFPCKHSLGLLFLAATQPDVVPTAEPPEWVASWLAKRASAHPAASNPASAAKTPDRAAAQAKRAAKRLALVRDGLESLDLWLCDLVRNGLSGLETQGMKPWEAQAARMVDAQAPGVAARLRAMGGIPGSSPDWPARLLGEMGKLALLMHAFRRLDALDPGLREDVRSLIGWTLSADEVDARGEHVRGEWVILGQWTDDSDPRLRTQRTWLSEAKTGKPALVLQFSVAGVPHAETFVPGTRFPGELVYWPSAYPLRARVATREGEATLLPVAPPGSPDIAAFLGSVADALSRQPWLDRFPCVLRGVTPVYGVADGADEDGERGWYVRDATGAALPLLSEAHWQLLAVSGGRPVDLFGEWDAQALRPLGVVADGAYTSL